MESGWVDVGGAPATIILAQAYVSPVVVCTVNYANNTVPVVARVGQVTATSFDVRLQNPSAGAVAVDRVHYWVVEEGAWTVDGVLIEAHTYLSTVTAENNDWVGMPQAYDHVYTSPVVLGQVMSENDPAWSVFWCQGNARSNPPSATTLLTGKTVCEDSNTTRAPETVGFIVIEAGHGNIAGVEFEAGLTADVIAGVGNSPPYAAALVGSFAESPKIVLATMAGVDGGNGGWAYTHGQQWASAESLFLSIDEDQIADLERNHTTEQVGTVAFADVVVFPAAQPCTTDGECDDSVYCNGLEQCIAGVCAQGPAVMCDDGVSCTLDSCVESVQACAHVPDGTACDNSIFCDGVETCDPVLGCVAGIPVTCDDGLVCTTDSCNEVTDTCDHADDDVHCDDGLFCTGVETCQSGACVTGVPPCAIELCNESTETCLECLVDADCSDGLFCNGIETCVADVCVAGADPCPGQSCAEASATCVASPTARLESGRVLVGEVHTTVALGQSYFNPVVVCSANRATNAVPVVARVSNITADSFDVRLQNPSGNAVSAETVSYLVVEAGAWIIDGRAIEAQTYLSTVTDTRNTWVGQSQSYLHNYADPVVVGQVMTENDAGWSVFWCQGSSRLNPPSSTALVTGKMVGEDPDTVRADERIGFIVFETGHGVMGDVEFEAILGGDTVRGPDNGPPFTYTFATPFATTPETVVASMAGMDGNNGGWSLTDGASPLTATTVDLVIDEDQVLDAERSHTHEQVSVIAFERDVSWPLPECAADATCDDGVFCNGVEVCLAGFCQPGPAVVCDDAIACTNDVCDIVTDACQHTPANALCDNGVFCDGLEICDPAVGCVGGLLPCPLLCDENTDDCVECLANADCDNGVFCDGLETCVGGTCLSGTVHDCDDGIECTNDVCDEIVDGCKHIPDNALCDNGVFCDGAETCAVISGCIAGGAPCPALCDETAGTCVDCLADADCDNGVYCDGVETCLGGTCQGGVAVECDDGLSCTADICDEGLGACDNVPDNAACDNGTFCDGVETCDPAVGCVFGTAPCPVLCDEASGSCVNCLSDTDCDNGVFCDGTETCSGGICQAGVPFDCDDFLACTQDLCDEETGTCVHVPDNTWCDNGLFCDGLETCDASLGCLDGASPCPQLCAEDVDSCVACFVDADCDNGAHCDGVEVCVAGTCQGGTAINCDDAIACTVDTCDEDADACQNTPDNALCNNGAFCDGAELCDPASGCVSTPGPCAELCDEASNECVECLSDADCANGEYCDGAEACLEGVCQAGQPIECSDGVSCTNDVCDEVADVCRSTTNDALCTNGQFCDGVEACDPVDGCVAGPPPCPELCDETADSCVNCLSDADCDNGVFCDGAESCSGGTCQSGTPVDCADGIGCTVDACNESTDTCMHTPDDVVCTNGLFCDGMETCDPILDCVIAGSPCPALCDEATDACVECLVDADCTNGMFCDGSETCLAGSCQEGTPVDCDDGVGCTTDVCNEVADVCVSTPEDSSCTNGLFCDGAESCDPVAGCVAGPPCAELCDETADLCVSCLVDTDCDNGAFCDGVETCAAGVCQAGAVVDCDDGIDCTTDGCDEITNQCQHTPENTLCDNGLFCDGTETCDSAAGCVSAVVPCPLLCDENTGSCVNCLSDSDCSNALYCDGVEICVAGSCQVGIPVDCDDAIACTVDACDETTDACLNTPMNVMCDNGQFCDGAEVCDALAGCVDTTPPCAELCDEANDACVMCLTAGDCDNGVYCDGLETCVAGSCQAGTPVACDDAVDCTVDLCDEIGDGCQHVPVDTVCDNGVFCDGAETCDAVTGCAVGTPPCPLLCDESGGSCVSCLVDEDCDNGAFCDGAESCAAGVCQAGSVVDCADGVACTVDVCDEATDTCQHIAEAPSCANGQFCDGVEVCDPVAGCVPGPAPCPLACDEVADSCVECLVAADCDNGLFCDGAETCNAGVCQSGTPIDCDDSIGCTADMCDETLDACRNVVDDSACDNGVFCDGFETCDPVADCLGGVTSCPVLCDETAGSCVDCLDDGDCDDGAYCNGVETCAAGTCQGGVAVECDDAIACTLDVCDEAADACQHVADDVLCDNGLFCDGLEACDLAIGCVGGIPCPTLCDEDSDSCVNCLTDADCDNGAFCDGTETCTDGVCTNGAVVECDDGVGCTEDMCDDAVDACQHIARDADCDNGQFCDGAETCSVTLGCVSASFTCPVLCDEAADTCVECLVDSDCDNTQFCDGAETCVAGSCEAGTAVNCDDGVGCTTDMCDEMADVCQHIPQDGLCANGDFCDGVETCDVLLGCVDGTPTCPVLCDETTDTCVNCLISGDCDNGSFCDGVETCTDGLCVSGTAVSCDDGVDCTTDVCDDVTAACQNVPDNTLCDNELFCDGQETCDGVVGCVDGAPSCPLACDEGADQCVACLVDADCANGVFCDGAELCSGGTCVAGARVACDDGLLCTADACDEATAGCQHVPLHAVCDNGEFCDGVEVCDTVVGCVSGPAACPVLCDENSDSCVNCLTAADCDNGLFCDGAETCIAGSCQSGLAVDCDDALECTTDACDEASDACQHIADDAVCDNGSFCDGAETCDQVEGCVSGTPVCQGLCDESTDSCVACLVDGDCANGAYCDGAEICVAGVCQNGVAVDCDDAVACTADACDEVTDACQNTPDDTLCANGLFCDGVEVCDPLQGCLAAASPCPALCDEDADACVTCLVDADCNNGAFCDGLETCVAGACQAGAPVDCDDAIACTTDQCDEDTVTCLHAPDNAICDNGMFCDGVETCDVVAGCVSGTVPCSGLCNETVDSCVECLVDADCDNGAFCDGPETCVAGVCQPATPIDCDDALACTADVCDEVADRCLNTPDDVVCDNGLFCDGAELCDVTLGCVEATAPCAQLCDEESDSCVECLVAADCDNGAFCDGLESCVTGTCQAGMAVDCDDTISCTVDQCDEDADACVSTANDELCDNGDFCDGAETCDVAAGCVPAVPPCAQLCDEAADSCVSCLVDADCDNSAFCDGAETCIAGACQNGTPVECDDAVGCTVDQCNEVADACSHTPDDALCDNGVFCDGAETCDGGVGCVTAVAPCPALCDEVTDSCVTCLADVDCDNGAFCDGPEACVAGACQGGSAMTCDDGVGCTTDLCDEVDDVCQHVPDDGACDNGLFCDGAERCDVSGGCLSVTDPCPALCDEDIDACVSCLSDVDCDNGLYCDGSETCIAGVCLAGVAVDCADAIGCTTDVCDDTIDACQHLPSNELCTNGLFCDGVEVCDPLGGCMAGELPCPALCDEVAGGCVECVVDADCDNSVFCDGIEICAGGSCQAGTPVMCDDAIACTSDLCDEAVDTCVHLANDSLCDDGLFCDGSESCDPVSGCVSGAAACPILCDEATDSCVSCMADTDCTNGAFCDGVESCVAGSCQSGAPIVCDDEVDCTVDFCDETTDACLNTPDDALCDNGLFCDGEETCDAVAGCVGAVTSCPVLCDEITDSCVVCLTDADCANTSYCDGVETCFAGACQAGMPRARRGVSATKMTTSVSSSRLMEWSAQRCSMPTVINRSPDSTPCQMGPSSTCRHIPAWASWRLPNRRWSAASCSS